MKFQQPYRRQTNQDYTHKIQEYLVLHARHIQVTFLSLLIHLPSTPHSFTISFGGQWGLKGSKEIKIRVTKTLLPKCLRARNRRDISKGNKTPLDVTGITSLLRNAFCILVLVPPNHCLHLAETSSCCPEEATLQLVLAGCSSLASTHYTSKVSHCLAPSPPSLPSLLVWMLPLWSTHIALCFFGLESMFSHRNKTSRHCRVTVRNNGAIGGFAGKFYKVLIEMLFKELLAFSCKPKKPFEFPITWSCGVLVCMCFDNPRIKVRPFVLYRPTYIFRLNFRLLNFSLEVFRLSKNSSKMLPKATHSPA